ncbi:MAG TPA: hypothetical protein DIC42_05970 [Holosporales bacterium]|nr:hypothetical protein [Holosporales bacterium]
MSFRKKIQILGLNTIDSFQNNKSRKRYRTTIKLHDQKFRNRNDGFLPNDEKAASFFYIIPEITFLLIIISILYTGLKYAT